MTASTTLGLLSRLEGLSLLGLLLIAMPLKYGLDIPLAVRIAGSVHGALFLALWSTSLQVVLEKALPKRQVLRVLGWSLVPFGFLLVGRDHR